MADISTDAVIYSVSEQKRVASLEADQLWMETLAAKRAELQQALQEHSTQSDCWMATTKSSFFLVSRKEPLMTLLQKELQQVDDEIRRVCDRIMMATEE